MCRAAANRSSSFAKGLPRAVRQGVNGTRKTRCALPEDQFRFDGRPSGNAEKTADPGFREKPLPNREWTRLRKAYGAAGYEWTRTREQTTADGRKYRQMILFGERDSSFTDTPEALVDILMPSFSKRYQRSSAVGFPRLLIRVHSRFAF